jgi:hypothetical protein
MQSLGAFVVPVALDALERGRPSDETSVPKRESATVIPPLVVTEKDVHPFVSVDRSEPGLCCKEVANLLAISASTLGNIGSATVPNAVLHVTLFGDVPLEKCAAVLPFAFWSVIPELVLVTSHFGVFDETSEDAPDDNGLPPGDEHAAIGINAVDPKMNRPRVNIFCPPSEI